MRNQRAGKLRQIVTIQRPGTEDQDSVGQPVPSWVDFLTVRAEVEPLSGREYFGGQQLLAEVTTRITIRYLAGIKSSDRVVFDGDNYDILDVIDVEQQHRQIQLMCRTGLIDVNS